MAVLGHVLSVSMYRAPAQPDHGVVAATDAYQAGRGVDAARSVMMTIKRRTKSCRARTGLYPIERSRDTPLARVEGDERAIPGHGSHAV